MKRALHRTVNEIDLAIKMVETRRALVVVYKETAVDDGFVITAFSTTRLASLEKRKQLWPPLK
jgi:hypothetical protein